MKADLFPFGPSTFCSEIKNLHSQKKVESNQNSSFLAMYGHQPETAGKPLTGTAGGATRWNFQQSSNKLILQGHLQGGRILIYGK